jgi:hypothetical protein
VNGPRGWGRPSGLADDVRLFAERNRTSGPVIASARPDFAITHAPGGLRATGRLTAECGMA